MTDDDALSEIVLHGHRVFYRAAGDGPVIVLVHGITSTSATWANVHPVPCRALHGDRARPARPRRARPSRAATTRSAPTRAASATCSSRSDTTGRRSSGTRSAAAWRCSWPTSSPSAASASCSSAAAGSAARSHRCCARPPSRAPSSCSAARRRRSCCDAGRAVGRLLGRARSARRTPTSGRSCAGTRRWRTRDARAAFLHTLRGIVDSGGQRVNASDRLYLAAGAPLR